MVKDWRGTELKVGSLIVYPGRASSSMWMTEAQVISFEVIEEEKQRGLSGSNKVPAEVTIKVKLTGRSVNGYSFIDSSVEEGKLSTIKQNRWTVVG